MKHDAVTLESVLQAQAVLTGKIVRTPLIRCHSLDRNGLEIYLKLENFQRTGAFKFRGCLNKVARLSPAARRRGLVAASSGNHAQGLALAGALKNLKVTIVMPEGSARSKIAGTRAYGAEVILHGAVYDDAYRHALALAENTGATYVHSFDDPDIIAGQGTIGLEILEDLPEVDAVVAPIGGGGLISGLGVVLKNTRPDVLLVGCQSQGAPSMVESLRTGQLCELVSINTLADGIAVRRPGELTFRLAQHYLDRAVVVPDRAIARAVNTLATRAKIVAEPAAAAPWAAIEEGLIPLDAGKVVCVITGGNIDAPLLSRFLAESTGG